MNPASADTSVVDIFIPFWGDPDLLMEAIDSVCRQTDPHWILTVVDDCYPVAVESRITALGDSRIRYFRNEHNLGITDNYRNCVKLAENELVVLFGCDDVMDSHYLATVRAAAHDYPTASIIQPGVQVISEHGHVTHTLRDQVKTFLVQPRSHGPLLLSGESAAASLLWGNWLYWPALTFRRSALISHDFRDSFPIIQDLALVIDIIADGGDLLYIPTRCFRYRRHSASASSASSLDGRRFLGERKYLDLACDLMKERGWRRASALARTRLLSRLDAVTVLPTALKARQWHGAKILVSHIFSFRRLKTA